jgi:UDP-N-acetylmuramoylalanine--D-glutamate ligase
VAAALALAARGERVVAVDSGRPDVEVLRDAGVEVSLGVDGLSVLPRARTVIKSPGVPDDAPLVTAAREQGVPVMGELELAWRLLPNEFIAVTGTNGKTTTVEWIGHLHREAGLPVAVAGNVGTALSSLIGRLDPSVTIVCEASSFQLQDTIEFAPEAAVLLNLAPDHLDRHGTMEAYRDAKLRIFANQGNDDVAVAPLGLGVEDLGGCARRVCFGDGPGAEMSVRSGELWWVDRPLLTVGELGIPGAHNVSNALAAAAVTLARGLDVDAVVTGLRNFTGVAHRLEPVLERDGVTYVNDSKATNVASTLVALQALGGDGPRLHLILGGQGKGQDFDPLAGPVATSCAAVYLIGEDGPLIGRALADAGVALRESGTLEAAVGDAAGAATAGDTVLLSPACASFDQFADFEARGDRFRALVRGLG